jgi:hypothetical protein
MVETSELRGVPILAHGVGGAIAGTNPAAALIGKESRRGRKFG